MQSQPYLEGGFEAVGFGYVSKFFADLDEALVDAGVACVDGLDAVFLAENDEYPGQELIQTNRPERLCVFPRPLGVVAPAGRVAFYDSHAPFSAICNQVYTVAGDQAMSGLHELRRPGIFSCNEVDNIACIAYYIFMKKLQYTIRNIPPAVDRVIRKRAQRAGKSFNATVVEALTIQTLGGSDIRKAKRDIFDRLQGANSLDGDFDRAVKEQSEIDGELWS